MASMLKKKITELASSPQGKKLTDKVHKIANDPKTREQIENAKRKLNERRSRGGGGPKAA
jgi:hypothetical protein